MANIFDQITDKYRDFEEAAARAGATEVLDDMKDKAVEGAVGLGAMGAASALGPENVDRVEQLARQFDNMVIEPVKDELPQGVGLGVKPDFMDPAATTVTPRIDLSVIPGWEGQAQATVGQGGLLDYKIDAEVPIAQVPMGDFTGTLNYGPQGGTMGVNYAQDGFNAFVNARVPERTASVKGLLDSITAGFRYTRNF